MKLEVAGLATQCHIPEDHLNMMILQDKTSLCQHTANIHNFDVGLHHSCLYLQAACVRRNVCEKSDFKVSVA